MSDSDEDLSSESRSADLTIAERVNELETTLLIAKTDHVGLDQRP